MSSHVGKSRSFVRDALVAVLCACPAIALAVASGAAKPTEAVLEGTPGSIDPKHAMNADRRDVIWARVVDARSFELMYAFFQGGMWSSPRAIGTYDAEQLDPTWWETSRLHLVLGTPGDIDPHVLGSFGTPGDPFVHHLPQVTVVDTDTTGEHLRYSTPGDAFVHDRSPHFTIDLDESTPGQTRLPWTIYVDKTVLVIPNQDRSEQPMFSVTRKGETVVPTVVWAEYISAVRHETTIAIYEEGTWGVVRVPANSIAVVQGTPGSVDPESLPTDGRSSEGTVQVASMHPRIIDLRSADDRAQGSGESAVFSENDPVGPLDPASAVIWARAVDEDSFDLVYARFRRSNWSLPQVVGTDTTGQLDPRWWEDLQLSIVTGTPGDINPHLLGTPGDGFVHDQFPDFTIDTDESSPDQTRLPARGWTIYLDNSILLLPSLSDDRVSEPTFSVTRVGEVVVPTVAWERTLDPNTHESVIARFINGTWVLAETTSIDPLDDVELPIRR